MPGRGAPTFLKRQKEQARIARANAKRAGRQARRESRAAAKADDAPLEDVPVESNEQEPGNEADSAE